MNRLMVKKRTLFYRVSSVRGYILPLTLILLSGIMMVVSYLFTQSSLYEPFVNTSLMRIKAQELAYGGLQIAIAQLAYAGVAKDSEDSSSEKMDNKQVTGDNQDATKKSIKKDDPSKLFLTDIAPLLYRWQTYKLDEKKDGVDGVIKICLMSEEGKIPLNKAFDFSKGVFIAPYNSLLKTVMQEIEKKSGATNMVSDLIAFLKNRSYMIQDISELTSIPSWVYFSKRLWYQPLSVKDSSDVWYLADLFTIDGEKKEIDPWLISPSVKHVLGFRHSHIDDQKAYKKEIDKVLAFYKANPQWEKDWDVTFKELYGKEFKTVPKEIVELFQITREPTLFSVLVHGTVGRVTARLYAVITRTKQIEKNMGVYDITIKRTYWL